ncbi:MAG: thiamine phosphate synthase [Deltaproteobacteria bacterium]|nr:thiamine phosphate synthase [Deltaproteobacteria bacterium]
MSTLTRQRTLTTLPRVLVFTDVAAARARGRAVLDVVARMFDDVDVAGAVAVVVRDKGAAEVVVARRAAAVTAIAARAGALVLVHTHARLVGALGLHGVHLDGRADADACRAARLRLPPGALLGVSRHVEDVPAGRGGLRVADADYATLSPVFPPASKPDDTRAPLGPAALTGHTTPVFALGGVDAPRARACVAAGAHGVAVLGGVMGARDPRAALRALLAATALP